MAKSYIKGGAKLNAFLRKAKAAKTVKSIEIGFFEGSKYPDGTPVATVAAWNEFGTHQGGREHTPERPFIRNAIESSKDGLKMILKTTVNPRTMVVNRKTAGLLGEHMQGEIKRNITILRDPPNAPLTIARKGSSDPLLNTGDMRREVNYRVDEI